MAVSKLPKKFETQVFKAFSEVDGVSIDRIPDQVTKYKGSSTNICDYVVYKQPTLLYLECKTVHGNTLPFSNIRQNQWDGLIEKAKIPGVKAGVICWWVDKDVTLYISIQDLVTMTNWGTKSVRYDVYEALQCEKYEDVGIVKVEGKKKRTYFDYDMTEFFNKI